MTDPDDRFKVFISWSGPLSQRIATILNDWIPTLIQRAETFYSTDDIRKGKRWSKEIQTQLGSTSYGIAVLTKTNLHSRWLLYECGALTKSVDSDTALWTVLVDGLKPTDFDGPLSDFQHTTLDRADFGKLLHSIDAATKAPVGPQKLDRVLGEVWKSIKKQIDAAVKSAVDEGGEAPGPTLTVEDMQRETLELVRRIAPQVNASEPGLLYGYRVKSHDDLADAFKMVWKLHDIPFARLIRPEMMVLGATRIMDDELRVLVHRAMVSYVIKRTSTPISVDLLTKFAATGPRTVNTPYIAWVDIP